MKWTKDGRYFGRDDQVDAYDRGEPVKWENVHGEPETQEIARPESVEPREGNE